MTHTQELITVFRMEARTRADRLRSEVAKSVMGDRIAKDCNDIMQDDKDEYIVLPHNVNRTTQQWNDILRKIQERESDEQDDLMELIQIADVKGLFVDSPNLKIPYRPSTRTNKAARKCKRNIEQICTTKSDQKAMRLMDPKTMAAILFVCAIRLCTGIRCAETIDAIKIDGNKHILNGFFYGIL